MFFLTACVDPHHFAYHERGAIVGLTRGIHTLPEPQPGVGALFFADPDGTCLELIQAPR